MNGIRAIALIASLWAALGYPGGDLLELGTFSDTLDLVDDGVLAGPRCVVVRDFVIACERVAGRGGPEIVGDISVGR